MTNIHKIILKFKFRFNNINIILIFGKQKQSATISNLYNNLNLMQHVTCVSWNEGGLKKKKKILRYVQISQPIMIYLKKLF